MEQWKSVSANSSYEVSNLGRLVSLKRGRRVTLKGSLDKKGYLCFALCDGLGGLKTRKIHTLVAKAFIPNPLNLPYVDHVDTDKSNNASTNLEWVTNKENMRRSWERGTHKPSFGNTKLTQVQRDQILKLSAEGVFQRDISKIVSISQAAVSNVVRGLGILNKSTLLRK